MNKILPFAFFLLASSAFANPTGTEWFGTGELLLNGAAYCSENPAEHPVYQPANGGVGLTIREVGGGADVMGIATPTWLWIQFSGGCATGFLDGWVQLQIDGMTIRDKFGAAVGAMSGSGISVQHVIAEGIEKAYISNLAVQMQADSSARVDVRFQSPTHPGAFEFVGHFGPSHPSSAD